MSVNKVEKRKSVISDLSAKVSDINRNLVLAGIGVIWIFVQTDKAGTVILEDNLVWALILFVASISLEFLQYVLTILVNFYYLRACKKNKDMPTWYSYIPWIFWAIKVLLMIWAYVLIYLFLIKHV